MPPKHRMSKYYGYVKRDNNYFQKTRKHEMHTATLGNSHCQVSISSSLLLVVIILKSQKQVPSYNHTGPLFPIQEGECTRLFLVCFCVGFLLSTSFPSTTHPYIGLAVSVLVSIASVNSTTTSRTTSTAATVEVSTKGNNNNDGRRKSSNEETLRRS